MTSSPRGERRRGFYLWCELNARSQTRSHTHTKNKPEMHPRMNAREHARTHKQVRRATSVWQMREVNCLSLTSWEAAGGYECCVIWREGKWIRWPSLFVSEAISHLSFPPRFHSPVTFSLFCNIAAHLSVCLLISLFLIPPDAFWSVFGDICPCVTHTVYDTVRHSAFSHPLRLLDLIFPKALKLGVLDGGKTMNTISKGLWQLWQNRATFQPTHISAGLITKGCFAIFQQCIEQ